MRIQARSVADYAAMRRGFTFADLCSERRTRPYARARQIAMYCIRDLCGHMSFPATGRLLGGRDHTTVIHGVRKIEALLPLDADIAADVAATIAYFRNADSNALDDEIARTVSYLGDLIVSRRSQMRAAA